jgi:hypothetical protein
MVLHQVWESTRSHFTEMLRSRLELMNTKNKSLLDSRRLLFFQKENFKLNVQGKLKVKNSFEKGNCPSEGTLLKFPYKFKMSKEKSICQQYDIVDW